MGKVDALKTKLDDWKRRLSERDVHSIAMQLGHMLWRSAFYRSINESRRYALGDNQGEKQGNAPLHELIDDGYFTMSAIAIRRLLDKGALSGPKGVYSLFALIRDIKDHAHLLTRANVLEARGLEYEFEEIKRRAYEEARADKRARKTTISFISGEGWTHAQYWHEAMDRLCGVSADSRSKDDALDSKKFAHLLEELDRRGSSVQNWVDKFVAHAASPDSRQTLHPDHHELSLAKLWLAERVIVRASNFIALYVVDGTNLGGVPIPQFDQFGHLDKPFVEEAALAPMQQAWDRHSNDIHACQSWFWDQPLADDSDVWKE